MTLIALPLNVSGPIWVRRLFAALAILCCYTGVVDARTVTLAWDKNPEADVVGYVVYVGTQPGEIGRAHV